MVDLTSFWFWTLPRKYYATLPPEDFEIPELLSHQMSEGRFYCTSIHTGNRKKRGVSQVFIEIFEFKSGLKFLVRVRECAGHVNYC